MHSVTRGIERVRVIETIRNTRVKRGYPVHSLLLASMPRQEKKHRTRRPPPRLAQRRVFGALRGTEERHERPNKQIIRTRSSIGSCAANECLP